MKFDVIKVVAAAIELESWFANQSIEAIVLCKRILENLAEDVLAKFPW